MNGRLTEGVDFYQNHGIMKNTILILLLLSGTSWSQVLPVERKTDWSIAGIKEALTDYSLTIYFEEEGGIGDGVFSNSELINTLISEHDGETFELIFPAGTFFFDENIVLPNNCRIAGKGADSTILMFNLDGASTDLIEITGTIDPIEIALTEMVESGAYTCWVSDVSSFNVGDWVLISDNDSALVTSDWAIGKSGQVLQIKAITGFELEFESPFRRSYLSDNLPHLKEVYPRKNVTIEDLKVKRIDETAGQTVNISFNYAVNCAISCVESEYCNFSHVRFQYASNCEVKGSYFHNAYDFGGGGKAYGVVCQFATGEVLVTDNNFKDLRHAMLLQAGANGNVFSYNYSQDPYWTDVALPENSAGDIVLHGNYVYSNLFEGNTCQNIVIDDSHGINGPYNTFFRNRAELYGIFMNAAPPSDRQNFIGNEITNEGFLLGLYVFAGDDHFFYGNNHKGEIKPAGTDDLNESSLYIETSPFYYEYYSNWPPIGYPNSMNEYDNEAFSNYHSGWEIQCQNTFEDLGIRENESGLTIFPNPSIGDLTIQSLGGDPLGLVEIIDITGRRVYSSIISEKELVLNDLLPGIYFCYALNTSRLLTVVSH